jgi:hypothetical protein
MTFDLAGIETSHTVRNARRRVNRCSRNAADRSGQRKIEATVSDLPVVAGCRSLQSVGDYTLSDIAQRAASISLL